MFAYVLMGLWLDRFFVWLGAFVTIATLVGYFFIAALLLSLDGGHWRRVAVRRSGLFIRKNWK